MAEGKKDDVLDKIWDDILNIKFEIHHNHGNSYLTPKEYDRQIENLSKLRRLNRSSDIEISLFNMILKMGRKNYKELQEWLYNKPRRDAQKFIGNKKNRETIFNLHGYICLCCGKVDDITLDHIVPIYYGGENSIENLQPLCRGCNSSKGTKTIDYR